jgi:hypothetical protein
MSKKITITMRIDIDSLDKLDSNLTALKAKYSKYGVKEKELKKVFNRSAFMSQIAETLSEEWAVMFVDSLLCKSLGIDYKQGELFDS